MDINLLSELLKELILEHDRVSLPGMGSFISEAAPSVFSDRASVIHPPFKRILFRSREIWNDELLEKKYSELLNIPLEDAKFTIAEFIDDLRRDLEMAKILELPGLGTIRLNERSGYSFVIHKDVLINKDAYGLEPLNIKILSKPGIVEILRSRPMKIFKTEEKIKQIKQVEQVEQIEPKESHHYKLPKSARIILSIILVLVVVIVLILVFSDQLKPLWEVLLYNKHEQELLKLLK